MPGEKPVVKVTFKSKTLSEDGKPRYIALAAYWERDGRLSGGLERKIRGVVIHYDDGATERVSANDYFLNVYDDRGGPAPRPAAVKKPAPKPAALEPLQDDDIPF